MAKTTLLLLLVSALAISTPGASASVARFETTDIILQADRSYDGRQGVPNPFTDVTLTAQVTSPSGRRHTVTGFFDGDGQGGSAGRIFKLRLTPDETGTWTWTTTSNQVSLHGKSGSFRCDGSLSGVFSAGPVEVNPERPRSFRYRDGQPVYLIGKFLDVAAPARIRFSHTMFSEELTDADRQDMLDRHAGMRLNKINVYVANRGDYASVSTTPWVGTAFNNDKTRFDLSRWHVYEAWVRRLRDAGMVAHLWFFADDSGFGNLPDADQRRLLQYGMARLSGYANTMFTLALEWQEGWTPTEVQTYAQYLHQQNPWDRLVSVHGLTGAFSFPGASWADYMDIQAGNEVDHDRVYDLGLLHISLADKPLIQEEHGLGTEDGPHRKKAWAAFMAGAGGSGTGGFLEPLARFISTLPFERMEPSPLLVLSGDAYALAQPDPEPGQIYLFYLYGGGSVTVNLTALPGTLLAEWLNPRTGSFSGLPDVQGGGVRTFSAPGADDWTLILRRPFTPGEPPPSYFYTVPPCRLVDTRQGEALRSGQRTRFVAFGACEIPRTAKAVSANLTSVAPTTSGLFALWPGDQLKPVASSVNFTAGRNRANNAVLTLGEDGTVFAEVSMGHPSATTHLVIDVNGYFE
ncbi:MAG TPA: DUF5060 domain-containing protein [Thermoanaerobaculia bacterium]